MYGLLCDCSIKVGISCQAVGVYFFRVKTACIATNLVTDCKSDEVMILSPTSAACYYNNNTVTAMSLSSSNMEISGLKNSAHVFWTRVNC